MNGEHPLEALSAYLDGELDGAEHEALERHLESCVKCTSVLQDLERLARASAEETIPPVPADLADRIADRLPATPVRRSRLLPFRIPMAAAATLAAMGILGILWLQEPELQPELPRSTLEEAEDRPVTFEQPLDDDKAAKVVAAPENEPADSPALQATAAAPPARTEPEGFAERSSDPDPGAKGAPAPAEPRDLADAGAREQRGRADADKAAPREIEEEAKDARERKNEVQRRPATPAPQESEGPEKTKGLAEATPEQDEAYSLRKQSVPPPPASGTGVGAALPIAASEPAPIPSALALDDEGLLLPGAWMLQDPGYSIRLDPDGSLALRSGTFSCTLPPDPNRKGDQAGQEAGSTDRAAMLNMAIPGPGEDRNLMLGRVSGAEPALDDESVNRAVLEGPVVLWVESEGRLVRVEPEVADRIASRLHALVTERYTPEIAGTCGPLPPALRVPDDD